MEYSYSQFFFFSSESRIYFHKLSWREKSPGIAVGDYDYEGELFRFSFV